MATMPTWFPDALAAAQHQDRMKTWPWYGRLFHKLFVSRRCPACKLWSKPFKYKTGG